ncbi:MAG: HAD-IIIA family hydrolase [Candidatus Dadabacteria bacterium]|nr:HAD-IIIA family hydrolase [Candidatus Dadabacteria bacterium]NIQ13196.1 HAD-IIIA family hydrolase [Candidatus Dadabacteria bacterium]
MRRKAVFFDRDKTIILPNQDNYIYRVGDFYIPDDYIESLKNLYDNGFMLFVVTNQGRVAKGYLTEDDVNNVHEYLNQHFNSHEFNIQEFIYCPHNPKGHVSPYNIECLCRKPKTGMLEELIDKYNIESHLSWMIGDSVKDILAGRQMGLNTILVKTGYFHQLEEAHHVEDDIVGAVNRILNHK